MNQIIWTRKAQKQLLKIRHDHRLLILEAVDLLVAFPNCSGSFKPLTNHEYQYRLRVRSYRILFDFSGALKILKIQEVKPRGERTYQV